MPAMPTTTVQNTTGAITILMSRMKPSPSGFICDGRVGREHAHEHAERDGGEHLEVERPVERDAAQGGGHESRRHLCGARGRAAKLAVAAGRFLSYHPGPSTPGELSKKRVFVVDDDPKIGELFATVLARDGYATKGFTTAEALLQTIDDGTVPDLVLTDLMMPDISGMQLIEALESAAWRPR